MKKEPITLRKILGRYGSQWVLLLLIAMSGIIQPLFLTPRNISNLLVKAAPLGIVTVGQFFVILGGGLDISVASLMATTNIILAAGTYGRNELFVPIIILCLALGSGVGLTNGLLITKCRVSPFIITLGMMIFLQGVRFVWTKGAPRGSIPPIVRFVGAGKLGGVPICVVLFILLAVASFIVLNKTAYGRRLYATGGNSEAARLSGVSIDRVVVLTYVISGVMAVLAGLVLTGYLGFADSWAGKGYELESIAAVVIGGAVFGGGKGTIGGTTAGVLIMTVLANIVLLLNLRVEIQMILQGMVVIGAIAFYAGRRVR